MHVRRHSLASCKLERVITCNCAALRKSFFFESFARKDAPKRNNDGKCHLWTIACRDEVSVEVNFPPHGYNCLSRPSSPITHMGTAG